MVLRSVQRTISRLLSPLRISSLLPRLPTPKFNTKIHRYQPTPKVTTQTATIPPKMHTLFHPLHNTTHWHSPRNPAPPPNSPISLTKTSKFVTVPYYSLDDNNDCDVRPHNPAPPPNTPVSRTFKKPSTFVTVPYYSLDDNNDCDGRSEDTESSLLKETSDGYGTMNGEMREKGVGEEKSDGYGTVCEKMEYKEMGEEKCMSEEKGLWKRVWQCIGGIICV
jgi:hypothetical protein